MNCEIDLKVNQLHTHEQKIVLKRLAESAAQNGCKFIEIGSWCGDSASIIGKVAKKYQGHLICIDWWKGNYDTELFEIAKQNDVFSFFWERMRKEGLDDTVIPIRSRSDNASLILKEKIFDLIFFDADHRYENINKDIEKFSPMIKPVGGILCGHDCEGYLSDYDLKFLEAGKNADIYESVHCGVVLAVGKKFKNYSINHAVWSVRSSGKRWIPTNLIFDEIHDFKQTPVPVIGITKSCMIYRYGKKVYGIPYSIPSIDLRKKEDRKNDTIISANTLQELKLKLNEDIYNPPIVVSSYKEYDLINFDDLVFGIKKGALDHVELISGTIEKLDNHRKAAELIDGETIEKLKENIDKNQIVKCISE